MSNIRNKSIKYNKFICDFYNQFNKINNNYSELVFLCIGTDKMTGDCLGPLVGKRIKEGITNNFKCAVYGDLDNPLIYTNVDKSLKEIYENCEKPCIIAIDAALSKESDIGKILVKLGGMNLGRAINKGKKEIGDISIKAIVGKNYKRIDKNMEILQNTSLSLVWNLANIVSDGILEIMEKEYSKFTDFKLLYKI